MKTPESFGMTPEEQEKELQGKTGPMNMDEFKRVAKELEDQARDAGLESINSLPPDFPSPSEDEQRQAA